MQVTGTLYAGASSSGGNNRPNLDCNHFTINIYILYTYIKDHRRSQGVQVHGHQTNTKTPTNLSDKMGNFWDIFWKFSLKIEFFVAWDPPKLF